MSQQSRIEELQVSCFKLLQEQNFEALLPEMEAYSEELEKFLEVAENCDKDSLKLILNRHNELVDSAEAVKSQVGEKLSSLHKTATALKGYKPDKAASKSITGTRKG